MTSHDVKRAIRRGTIDHHVLDIGKTLLCDRVEGDGNCICTIADGRDDGHLHLTSAFAQTPSRAKPCSIFACTNGSASIGAQSHQSLIVSRRHCILPCHTYLPENQRRTSARD